MNNAAIGAFIIILSISLSGCASSKVNISGVRLLAQLGKNDKAKQRAERQETLNFQRVKTCLDKNKMKKGISSRQAIKRFGEPVVVLAETKGEKWIYKSSGVDWLGGEKIYLFFDREGRLTGWEYIN
jgi:hypothetical protein